MWYSFGPPCTSAFTVLSLKFLHVVRLSYHVSQKTARFYFCYNFIKLRSVSIFLAGLYFSKFSITGIFQILHKVESREPA